MSRIKHIVFPVDFSDRSNGAVPFVAEMARRHDANVTLLAVAHLPHVEWPEAIDPQLILDGVKSRLESAYVSDFAGLTVARTAVLGDPARAITDFVAANKVDLVMMPTHGYVPFARCCWGRYGARCGSRRGSAAWRGLGTRWARLAAGYLGTAAYALLWDYSPRAVSRSQCLKISCPRWHETAF